MWLAVKTVTLHVPAPVLEVSSTVVPLLIFATCCEQGMGMIVLVVCKDQQNDWLYATVHTPVPSFGWWPKLKCR